MTLLCAESPPSFAHYQPRPDTAELALQYFRRVNTAGGPAPSQFEQISRILDDVDERVRAGVISQAMQERIVSTIVAGFAPGSIVRQVRDKPRGYAGDFQVIDRILSREGNRSAAAASGWDAFFFETAAVRAVQRRMAVFHSALSACEQRGGKHVLNLASGPARDVARYLTEKPQSRLRMTCLDNDADAVAFSRQLLESVGARTTSDGDASGFPATVECLRANPFRHRPQRAYDLIWSSGLFDYASDGLSVAVLARLYRALAPGGSIVVGNFAPQTSDSAFRETVLEWRLKLRSERHLAQLARAAAPEAHVHVRPGALGEIYYLELRRA